MADDSSTTGQRVSGNTGASDYRFKPISEAAMMMRLLHSFILSCA